MQHRALFLSSLLLCGALACTNNDSDVPPPDTQPIPDMSVDQTDASDDGSLDASDAHDDLGQTDMEDQSDASEDAPDDASETDAPEDTSVPLCALNEYVSQGACAPCDAGSVNEAGDDPSGQDTECVDACIELIGQSCGPNGTCQISTSMCACDPGFFACAVGGCCAAAPQAPAGPLTGLSVSGEVSFALDARDLPHVAFTGAAQEGVQYTTWSAGAWATQPLEAAGLGGAQPSLALDANGYPHIAFYDTINQDLKYAVWTGSGFAVEVVDAPGDVGGCVSLQVDASGQPHIAYHDETQGQLKYARFDGATWSIASVDGASSECSISLALDSQQRPQIAYKKTSTDLFFASFDGAMWQPQFVYAPPRVNLTSRYGALHNTLRMDSQDQPHILTHDSTTAASPARRIQYLRWDGTQWQRTQVASADQVGNNDLALDAQDRVHMTAFFGGANQLSYRRLLSSGDPEPGTNFTRNARFHHALTLDQAQHPHILSTHEVNGALELRYARYDGSAWLE